MTFGEFIKQKYGEARYDKFSQLQILAINEYAALRAKEAAKEHQDKLWEFVENYRAYAENMALYSGLAAGTVIGIMDAIEEKFLKP